MNYLLDTHVLLWMLAAPGNLNAEALEAIQNPRHAVFVSAVSSVEISIKRALGKLEVPEMIGEEVERRGFQLLPLRFVHGEVMSALPPHHQDPFDRMLVAQAQHERLALVTRDRKLEPYDIRILWT